MITRYYEVTVPFNQTVLERTNDIEVASEIMEEMSRKGFTDYIVSVNDEDEFVDTSIFDWKRLLLEDRFLGYLDIEVSREKSSRQTVERYIDRTEKLLDVIRLHINT